MPGQRKISGVRRGKLRLGLQGKVIVIVLITVWIIMSTMTIYELSPARNFGRASFKQKVDIVMARVKMPMVALIFASVLLVFLLSRFVISPIQEASEASIVISSGDLTRRIGYLSNDEIGDFAHSFNDMAISLLKSRRNLERSYLNTVAALASAVDAKDPYTRGHSENVMRIASEVASRLNLPEDSINMIKYAGLLHDIGKISLPISILHKRGPLNEDERKIVRRHPVIGSVIVENVSFLEQAVPAIRHHHENYNGSGYPDGISGGDIPIMARILNVADALDTMISRRPYKEPYSLEKVMSEIREHSGGQFDPGIAEIILDMLGDDGFKAIITANVERLETEPLEEWEEI